MNDPAMRIVLHASSPASLERARSNAKNAAGAGERAVEVWIVVNGAAAVTSLLDQADATVDPLTWVCPNTLRGLKRQAAAPLRVLEEGAVLAIARLQQVGWHYIHA